MNNGRATLWAIVAAFAAVYLIWGSTYLVIRFAIETIPPLLMAGVRFGTAGVVLYIAMRRQGEPLPTGRQMANAAIVGGLLLMMGNGGVSWAEQYIPSGVAALITAMIPCWMVVFAALAGEKRPGMMDIAALVSGAAGVALLAYSGEDTPEIAASWAVGVVLVGSCCWAFGSMYARGADMPASPLMSTALQMMFGGAMLSAAGSLSGEASAFRPEHVSLSSLLALLYLIVFGSLVAFSAYVWLLRVVPPSRVASYAYVNPLIAVLLGWALGDEPLDAKVGLAAALVVIAVVLITTTPALWRAAGRRVAAWAHDTRRSRIL